MGIISTLFLLFAVCNLLHFKIKQAESFAEVQTRQFQWKLRNSNGTINVRGRVPGGVYTDLFYGGILTQGDFYYRFNDVNYRRFSYDNWTYSTYFKVPKNVMKFERIALEFDGLDTISTVKFNGKVVGKTDNMFVKYIFEVKNYIKKSGKQKLEIMFESPVGWSKKAYEVQNAKYLVPPTCVDPAYHGECHANHIRKMQASFGWDWGPAFPNMGVWKDFRIIGWSSVKIDSIMCTTLPNDDLSQSRNKSISWLVLTKINLLSASNSEGQIGGKLLIELDGEIFLSKNVSIKSATLFDLEEEFDIPKNRVQTWWPNNLGSQPLYNLTVRWEDFLRNEVSMPKE